MMDGGGSPRTLETVLLQVFGWWSLVASCRNLREFTHVAYRKRHPPLPMIRQR